MKSQRYTPVRCPSSGCGGAARYWGVAMMILGFLILLLCVPFWVWGALIGLLMVILGFFLWRFS